jgi:hypothetical protein
MVREGKKSHNSRTGNLPMSIRVTWRTGSLVVRDGIGVGGQVKAVIAHIVVATEKVAVLPVGRGGGVGCVGVDDGDDEGTSLVEMVDLEGRSCCGS